MLKQGVKTISAEFIRKGALSQLSFIQFRPYATSFWGLLLSLTLMPKSKKTMETSLDLTLSFKTSIDARIEGLVSNVDYLEFGTVILFKRNMAEKDICCTDVSFSDCIFFA